MPHHFSTMPSVPTTPASHNSYPFIIPDATHPVVPSAHASENMAGRSVIAPDILHFGHASLLIPPPDEEQSQKIFSDSDSGMAESVHNELERTCGTIEHPHVLALALHGDLGLLVQDTVAYGQLGLFRIPDRPENASTPPTSGRASARVARRNRFFAALGGNSTAGPHVDVPATGDVLPPKVETQGWSPTEHHDVARETDHVLGRAVEGCTERNSTSLKPVDISVLRDNHTAKAKTCTTTH